MSGLAASLFLLALFALTGVYAFRKLVSMVDARADYLAAKYSTETLPAWSQLVIPISGVIMLVVLLGVSVVIGPGSVAVARQYVIQTGSRFVVFNNAAVSSLWGLAVGVVVATMLLPALLMNLGPERLQWAYLRANYIGRRQGTALTNVWLRTLLSVVYVIGVVVPPWIAFSDYVRVTASAICRRHIVDPSESCIAFRDLERIELKQETTGKNGIVEILNVFVGREIWASAQTGAGASPKDIEAIFAYLRSQPGVKSATMRWWPSSKNALSEVKVPR
jgi:hypothetical protein